MFVNTIGELVSYRVNYNGKYLPHGLGSSKGYKHDYQINGLRSRKVHKHRYQKHK